MTNDEFPFLGKSLDRIPGKIWNRVIGEEAQHTHSVLAIIETRLERRQLLRDPMCRRRKDSKGQGPCSDLSSDRIGGTWVLGWLVTRKA